MGLPFYVVCLLGIDKHFRYYPSVRGEPAWEERRDMAESTRPDDSQKDELSPQEATREGENSTRETKSSDVSPANGPDLDAIAKNSTGPSRAGRSARRGLSAGKAAAKVSKKTAAEKPAADKKPVAAATDAAGKTKKSWFAHRKIVQGSSSFLISTVAHIIILIVLGLWMLPDALDALAPSLVVNPLDDPAEELESVFLEEKIVVGTKMEVSSAAAGSLAGTAADVSTPELAKSVLETEEYGTEIKVEGALAAAPSRGDTFTELPKGALGQGRSIADNYGQAMDRITREILWMLEKQDVLVIWCFDQSESMKDDQKEISERIDRVYKELGLTHKVSGEMLLTAVTSYGEKFAVHTPKPTADLGEIRKAIASVPIDNTGKEMMCASIGLSVEKYRKFSGRAKRRLVLILVSDESGDREDNVQNMERAIAEARSAGCKIFILGREAVFGYPYAYISWRHPQTNRPYWLSVDRGPESAFVEQTQTDGFRRRYDAFPSGFGPYEQSRIARQTTGIFFLLPSLEAQLVRGEKRRYELEAMSAYHPDLRARKEILGDRDNSKFRNTLFQVIWSLNPHNTDNAKVIELRVSFSPDPQTFVKEVAAEHGKAKVYLQYLMQAEKTLEKIKPLRDEEPKPRWRANYDLTYAQMIAYQARVYEYGAYLDAFVKNPKVVPLKKSPDLRLLYWAVTTRAKTLTGDTIASHVKRASEIFKKVIKDHPGTPWAARAQWELNRGYGVDLVPHYEPEYKDVPNAIPVPKL